ncbi:ribonucleoside-diphosphate reductase subunit alpha [candidate division TM6 bacterium RIFCSPHIGHO2_12_FULL_38_8]|nr:MAG: ribonucleoside-diphosphate reductase subunit alpha [candidate division TM6 bacterium RIFCSPHIGHO2_12_FULL_38_8]
MDNQTLHSLGNNQEFLNNFFYEVKDHTGIIKKYSLTDISLMLVPSMQGFSSEVDMQKILDHAQKSFFPGMSLKELEDILILATVQFIECDNAYSYVAARLQLRQIFHEVVGYWPELLSADAYKQAFISGIKLGVSSAKFDARLLGFDLEFLADHLDLSRDHLFHYLGLKTLHSKYLKRHENVLYELPQAFWMRVAMGLALLEKDKNQSALHFYEIISKLLFVPSTPTLLHAGLKRAQLSSCYLSFIDDDLTHIFKCMGDNAQMSKWSGGVANDWTALRATGSVIKSIDICSQGTIPFMKVANDTTAAINRSGSRRGAVVAYMECWHYDFEEFLDLRRNTGDDRRRTHDMNTAAWIPDLFIKRVLADENWTLFSPEETPELHDLYGQAFEKKYVEYEQLAQSGYIRLFKTIPAKSLWRKHLTRLFETGHPWPTFKDACNIRSPQDHAGVVHSSNLCTEITLNTSRQETAVCNLGSINLGQFIVDGQINETLLAKTVKIAIRMLDNVIDINFYPTKEGQTSNFLHRPIGLGIMGLQDALYKLDVAFSSPQAMQISDQLTESVSYAAIFASSELAKERGAYSSFKGSKWDRNILPMDTIELLEKERGLPIIRFGKITKDWSIVRDHIKKYGMRNSNTMAVAPTATISNISGCFPCIEPIYKNLYAKSNSSGDFTVVNSYLIDDLKKIGMWNQQIRDQLKYYDGSLQMISGIPKHLKEKYKTAFELDPLWMVALTASRGKFIDQSQSHNVFMQGTSGKLLHDIYVYAWQCGLKTMYYLRTLGASQIEKSTLDAQTYGFTQMRSYDQAVEHNVQGESQDIATQKVVAQQVASPTIKDDTADEIAPKSCSLQNPECESCQ